MSHARHLLPEERTHLALLAETVYANPFGRDRERLGRLLGREVSTQVISQAELYGDLIPGLEARLGGLRRRGLARLADFHPEDRDLMRQVFLFHCWQAHIPTLERLIAQPPQQRGAAGGESPTLALLATLGDLGFDEGEARRFVALFYQLRRAYHYIERALVGRSEPMRALRQALWNSVFTTDLRTYALLLWERMEDFSTLLLGETGTGKGSAAAAIGRSGPIALDGPGRAFVAGVAETFVATNLAELSEGLIESELFGHRKGAFTGAIDHHDGLFARCGPHATLFLDEIGDVALPVQTKLLRVLQERSFTPVGSHAPQRFAGRIVAATNRSLEALLTGGHFRRDFFYRLSANIIRVPSLRERLADSPAELEDLVDALLVRLAGAAAGALRDRVLDALSRLPRDYPWPGNVRELEQALRRIILSGGYRPDLVPEVDEADPWLAAAAAGRLDAQALLGGYCRRLYGRLGTYEAVARVTGLDRRTVKRQLGLAAPAPRDETR